MRHPVAANRLGKGRWGDRAIGGRRLPGGVENEMTDSIARPGIWSDFPIPLPRGETRRLPGWRQVVPEQEVEKQMLVKILGGLMLAVGAFFALRMLCDILVAAASIAIAAALLYFGWRLVSRER